MRLEINSKTEREREREREREVPLIVENNNKKCNCETNFSSKFLSLLVIRWIKKEHIYI